MPESEIMNVAILVEDAKSANNVDRLAAKLKENSKKVVKVTIFSVIDYENLKRKVVRISDVASLPAAIKKEFQYAEDAIIINGSIDYMGLIDIAFHTGRSQGLKEKTFGKSALMRYIKIS